MMTNTDIILEFLDDISPDVMCDDCISDQAGIRPRQQVNQICNQLSSQSLLIRERAPCSSCGRDKLVSSVNTARRPPSVRSVRESTIPDSALQQELKDLVDIERIRTEIVQFCRALWKKDRSEGPPRSISMLVCRLRDEHKVPWHQANMMLTLCNLRNVYVYENLALGSNEIKVASGAWAIVKDWWNHLS